MVYPVTRTPLEVPAASIVTGSQLMTAIPGEGPCSSCTSRGASGGPAAGHNKQQIKVEFYINLASMDIGSTCLLNTDFHTKEQLCLNAFFVVNITE